MDGTEVGTGGGGAAGLAGGGADGRAILLPDNVVCWMSSELPLLRIIAGFASLEGRMGLIVRNCSRSLDGFC